MIKAKDKTTQTLIGRVFLRKLKSTGYWGNHESLKVFIKSCEFCAHEFFPLLLKKPQQRFCSRQCAAKAEGVGRKQAAKELACST